MSSSELFCPTTVDGDTIDVQCGNGSETQRVRLAVVDAPERGQPYFRASKAALEALCLGEQAHVEVYELADQYRRVVASVECRGVNSGEYLLKHGLAWYSSFYGQKYNLEYLGELEVVARDSKVGLWGESSPVRPYEYRRGRNE